MHANSSKNILILSTWCNKTHLDFCHLICFIADLLYYQNLMTIQQILRYFIIYILFNFYHSPVIVHILKKKRQYFTAWIQNIYYILFILILFMVFKTHIIASQHNGSCDGIAKLIWLKTYNQTQENKLKISSCLPLTFKAVLKIHFT